MKQPAKWATQTSDTQVRILSLVKLAEIQRRQKDPTRKTFSTAGPPVVILNASLN
jgi:hypothetical protein